MMIITSPYLIFLGLILPFNSLQVSSTSHGFSVSSTLKDLKPGIENDISLHDNINSVAETAQSHKTSTKLKSPKGHTTRPVRPHLGHVHGILKVIGWGTLLPTGAIVARFFRKSPLEWDGWYNFHASCQTSGYVLGSTGWAIGLWLGDSSKLNAFHTNRTLGIIIFTFSTIQVLALCLQPDVEGVYRRYWGIYHMLLGYALIAMIITNIFQGIHNVKGHAHEIWKWTYVSILTVLAVVAVSLEIYRYLKKPKFQQQNTAFHTDA